MVEARRAYHDDARCAPSIRLVALDLDGTILEAGRHVAPELVALLMGLARDGVRCTTATGRPAGFQMELFPRFGLGASAGVPHALMADERELFLLDPEVRKYWPHAPWNAAVRARWRELHPVAMAWLTRARDESRRQGWGAEWFLKDREAFERGLPTLACPSAEQAAALRTWLDAALRAEEPRLHCNRNLRLVQMHDALAGKGNVLVELARHWGLAPDEVLAIGDSANDFSMLDGTLGLRCATVGNADEAIKTVVGRAGGIVAAGRVGIGVVEILRTVFAL